MDEAVGRSHVHEESERGDARHRPVEHLALDELGRRFLLPPTSLLLRRSLLRQDEAVAALVGLDNLQRKSLADVVAKRVRHRAALIRAEVAHRR